MTSGWRCQQIPPAMGNCSTSDTVNSCRWDQLNARQIFTNFKKLLLPASSENPQLQIVLDLQTEKKKKSLETLLVITMLLPGLISAP